MNNDALEVLAAWCNEKGIGKAEYVRRCKEYDKAAAHDELVAALSEVDEHCQAGLNSSDPAHWEAALQDIMNAARAALAKAGAA